MDLLTQLKQEQKQTKKQLYCQSQKTEEHMRLLHRS